MSEEQSVATEVAEAVAQPENSEQVRQEESQASIRKRNDQEYNWAESRRKTQELERKLKEQDEYIKNLQQPKAKEDDELDKLADDEIVTKAQAKKLAAKMAQEIAGQVFKQREAATVNERLQLKYTDYDSVVTPDNIEYLKQTEPELALSLYHNPDPYAQGVAAYKLLKKIGTSSQPESVEKKKALENAQKPLSVNAVSKQSSAIGNAHLFENGLTDTLKKQLWDEMKQCAKRA